MDAAQGANLTRGGGPMRAGVGRRVAVTFLLTVTGVVGIWFTKTTGMLVIVGLAGVTVSWFLPEKYVTRAVVISVVLVPEARRILGTYHSSADPLAILAYVLLIPVAFRAFVAKAKLGASRTAWFFATTVVLYVIFEAYNGIVSDMYVLVIIIGSFGAAVLGSRQIHRRDAARWFFAASCMSSAYGVLQFFALPSWDATWIVASGLRNSIGAPVARQFRLFGTVDSPGPAAVVFAVGIVLGVAFVTDSNARLRTRLFIGGGVSLDAFALSLSGVRSGYIAVVVGLLVLIIVRRSLLGLLISVAGLYAAPAFLTAVGSKFGQQNLALQTSRLSFSNFESSDSFQSRRGLWAEVPRLLMTPFGDGPAAGGVAGKLGGAAQSTGATPLVLDNGLIDLLARTGPILTAGIALLLLVPLGRSIMSARLSTESAIIAVFLAAGVAGSYWLSPISLVLWFAVGLCSEVRGTSSLNRMHSRVLRPNAPVGLETRTA